MEKKKLKKLQINKMSGFLVISEQEQMMMKGGVGLRDLFEWALYDIGLTSQEVGQFFYEVGEKIENVAYHGGEILKSAAETYLTSLLGGPLSVPIFVIKNPSLYGIYDIDGPLYIGPS